MPATQTLRATLHPDALKRVTRMYGATLEDVIGELFQNARRAGATHVTATIAANPDATRDDMPYQLAVEDNGRGIGDPQVLMSFGQNGWDDSLVHAEDAAGMGFAAISRYHSQVSSRSRGQTPWTIRLEPRHFLGEAAATVHDLPETPGPTGTRVAVSIDEAPLRVRSLVEDAARHFPVPVTCICTVMPYAHEAACEQRPFLQGALHASRWEGLDIGILEFDPNDYPVKPSLNFFGHTVPVPLPTLTLLSGSHLRPHVDVRQCPDLELVLPARKDIVHNAFFERLKDRLRTILYEAARKTGTPVGYKDFQEAARRGVGLQPAPPRLARWYPHRAADKDGHLRKPIYNDVPEDAFIVSPHGFLECPEAWTLENALRGAGLMDKAFAPFPQLQGYDWYSNLPELRRVEPLVDGQDITGLTQDDILDPASPHDLRSNDLKLRLTFTQGGRDQVRVLPVDFILTGYPSDWCDGAACFVPRDTSLGVDALTRLYLHAYFEYADDGEFDSYETQEHNFRLNARREASSLLLSEDDALRQSVKDALADRIPWVFRKGMKTVITITGADLAMSRTDIQKETSE